MRLKSKVIVVTGGSGLLGSAFIKEISQQGGVPIIADLSRERGEKLQGEVDNSFYVEMDITSKSSIDSAISLLESKYGKIDALVNCAYPRNKNFGRHFDEIEYEDFCENLGMHLGGYFLTSQRFVRYFLKQGYGNIVSMSSVYGVIPPKFEIYEGTEMTNPIEYAAIKSGVQHIMKYISKYCKDKNIRANCISPGGILDAQPDSFLQKYKDNCLSKGMLSPEDIAGALVYLLSDESKYVNGLNLIVDDGFTL